MTTISSTSPDPSRIPIGGGCFISNTLDLFFTNLAGEVFVANGRRTPIEADPILYPDAITRIERNSVAPITTTVGANAPQTQGIAYRAGQFFVFDNSSRFLYVYTVDVGGETLTYTGTSYDLSVNIPSLTGVDICFDNAGNFYVSAVSGGDIYKHNPAFVYTETINVITNNVLLLNNLRSGLAYAPERNQFMMQCASPTAGRDLIIYLNAATFAFEDYIVLDGTTISNFADYIDEVFVGFTSSNEFWNIRPFTGVQAIFPNVSIASVNERGAAWNPDDQVFYRVLWDNANTRILAYKMYDAITSKQNIREGSLIGSSAQFYVRIA